MQNPTKTFGLSTPMEVLLKLEFDLARLRNARSTKDIQFAALDLAIWGFHMIDWVLNGVTDDRHLALTGCHRHARGIVSGFIKLQSTRIGAIGFCHQIANTGKHRVLTHQPDDPSFLTSHTIHFDPPFVAGKEYGGKIFATAYLQDTSTGQQLTAIEFFIAMVEQWREFLKVENLYDWNHDDEFHGDPAVDT